MSTRRIVESPGANGAVAEEAPPIGVSVIIPAYQAWTTLPAVLDALAPQVAMPDREAILVDSSGGSQADELAAARPWLRVLALSDRTLPGRARNLGAEVARSDLLAFLDADAVPGPAWLDMLERSVTDRFDAVAGAVINGTPWHPIGTAGYLLEFANWLPARRGPLNHAASCNLLVRRPALERAGGFLEDVFPGEDTIFTFRLAQAQRLGFAPDAQVRHLNRTGVVEYMRHQRRLGAAFARACDYLGDYPTRAFAHPLVAPLAIPFRLLALGRRLTGHPREAAKATALLPILIAGLVAWVMGVIRSARG